MKLRVTPAAFAEIEIILTYIAERSPAGAIKVAETFDSAFTLLLRNPRLGRRTSNPRLRRLTLPRLPYLVFYELLADDLIIIAVRHGARDPKTMPDH